MTNCRSCSDEVVIVAKVKSTAPASKYLKDAIKVICAPVRRIVLGRALTNVWTNAMYATSPIKRAAQYVRMSTEQQQYSTVNQAAAIAAWAAERGIEIVATYEDAGRSGLSLAGRPGLRQMIADVATGPRNFDAILVYDVSRWGRFQDADESAHLEFLCRSAGVSVHYCAEPFTNDGTPIANFCKVMKRALAAEYSRELSEKVTVGKARLARLGFRQGGAAGYGLQRRLLDCHGRDKGVLAVGQRKSFTTDRVILEPGVPEEIATVRWIYASFADDGLSISEIRSELNARGILRDDRPWSHKNVRNLLTFRKYRGDNIWGATSGKLLAPRRSAPSDTWATCEGAFEAVVPNDLFERVRKKLDALPKRLSDQQLTEQLRDARLPDGRITSQLMYERGLNPKAYTRRFGSLANAYALCGALPIEHPKDAAAIKERLGRRGEICQDLRSRLEASGATFEQNGFEGEFLVNGEMRLVVYTAAAVLSPAAKGYIWQYGLRRVDQDLTLLARLNDKFALKDHFILPPREASYAFKFREDNEPVLECFRADNLAAIVDSARRVPLSLSTLPKRSTSGWENPYAIEPPLLGIPLHRPSRSVKGRRGQKPQSALEYAAAYFGRKRCLIDKAAATHAFTTQMITALSPLLRRPGVVESLHAAGLTTVPAALCEARRHHRSAADEPPAAPHLAPEYGSRNPDGLCALTIALFDGRKLSPHTVGCLSKMKDERQVEAVREMLMEQRCSYEFARVLLTVSAPEQLIDPELRHPINGRDGIFHLLEREAVKVNGAYRLALLHYPAEALALASLTGFARRSIEAECFAAARVYAGPANVERLQRVLTKVIAWRAAKASMFGRGHMR